MKRTIYVFLLYFSVSVSGSALVVATGNRETGKCSGPERTHELAHSSAFDGSSKEDKLLDTVQSLQYSEQVDTFQFPDCSNTASDVVSSSLAQGKDRRYWSLSMHTQVQLLCGRGEKF